MIDEKKYGPNLGKNSDPNLENYGQPSWEKYGPKIRKVLTLFLIFFPPFGQKYTCNFSNKFPHSC